MRPGRNVGWTVALAPSFLLLAWAGDGTKAEIPLNAHGIPVHACCETPRCCGTGGCCKEGETGHACASKACPKIPGAVLAWRLTELSDEELSRIETLDLRCHPVKGEVAKRFAKLRSLKSLLLEGTDVEDADLAGLADLPLVQLHLDETGIGDAAVAHLARIRTLKRLTIAGTSITRKGGEALAEALPQCAIETPW